MDEDLIPPEPPSPAIVAAAMYARDTAAQSMGIKITDIEQGHAIASMPVRADMIQGHSTCHGGMIFSLADTAFAYACNSRNQATVAAGCNIEFLKPAFLDDLLTAEARQVTQAGRSGIYDVLVSNQHGEIIATFRGKSAAIKGQVITP
ncbi:hydroxyphenylacetyl-CoA thioesterase PaaI [Undibacterium terreum]|uniref:Phenylacetic acid degradation protein PaaD n=1 Tax=Undibacterium terreum TaxID=1224302 RepID=A0A916UW28_9BURK|nr:hydroxyphenylacetyl-CoA thioesterase PaaI [Undibacterium terreum]GGC89967.1 phenylacetic acid degradation protein PaaD [Undibacterium terreum]